MQGDRTSELIFRLLASSSAPLDTKEILELVPQTRAIVFKRLTNLLRDGLIKGKQIGCGKGTWIWWDEKAIRTGEKNEPSKHDKIVDEILKNLPSPSETKEVEERVTRAIPNSTRALVFKRLNNLRGDGAIHGKPVGSGKGTWIWWKTETATEKPAAEQPQHDKITDEILKNLPPSETKEVEERVTRAIPNSTRALVFKRLNNLRGDGLIKGKQVGCGKGTWVWWDEKAIRKEEKHEPSKHDKIVDKILENLTKTPSETKEVEERITRAIPNSTRALVFKRLNNLRGDGAIHGKPVGSGKGTWIWWRADET